MARPARSSLRSRREQKPGNQQTRSEPLITAPHQPEEREWIEPCEIVSQAGPVSNKKVPVRGNGNVDPKRNPGDHKSSRNTLYEVHSHYGGTLETRSTLNNSASRPGQLVYVMLFSAANPRWRESRTIFCKTNLELLPDTSDASKQSPMPIAVFEQGKRSVGAHSIRFAGWFTVGRVEMLQPETEELVCMLRQKWDRKSREVSRKARKWTEDLARRWAVVQLKRCDRQHRPPSIAHRDAPVLQVKEVDSAAEEDRDAFNAMW